MYKVILLESAYLWDQKRNVLNATIVERGLTKEEALEIVAKWDKMIANGTLTIEQEYPMSA